MDIKRMLHVVTLADTGSFVRAAEAVHLSQPAFSRSIQAAEAELGMKLFGRGGGTELKCTPSGAFFVERARRVLQESRRLDRDVGLFKAGQAGTVSIGAGPFVAASALPTLLVEMRRRFPGAGVVVQVDNPVILLGEVARERHDFFIGDTREVPRDGSFEIRAIGRKRGRFYVRTAHPLRSLAKVRLADVAPYGIASGRLPAALRSAMAKAMGLDSAEDFPVALECDDTHLVRHLALTTDTVMVGIDDILQDELKSGRLHLLEITGFAPAYSDVGIVSLPGRTPSPLAQFASDRLAELAGVEISVG